MEKRHLKNLLLGGALAAGLGIAAERGCDKDTDKDTPPKPKAEQIHKPEKNSDTLIDPRLVVRDTREKIDTATASPKVEDNYVQPTEDEPASEPEITYDQRIITAIQKLFPGTETITIGDESVFDRIRIGDYFLVRNKNQEGSYTLEKWVGDESEYDVTDYFSHTTQSMIDIVPQPDGTLTLRGSSNLNPDASYDESTLVEAIPEYIEFNEDFANTQYHNYLKQNKTYAELEALRDYYKQRLQLLEELKTKKWRFLRNDKEYQEAIVGSIFDSKVTLQNIEDEIAQYGQ